jgi:hypothetical protein
VCCVVILFQLVPAIGAGEKRYVRIAARAVLLPLLLAVILSLSLQVPFNFPSSPTSSSNAKNFPSSLT